MTKNTSKNIIGKSGMNALRSLIEDNGSIFREIHQEDDIGFDASIEFCQKSGQSTGVVVYVQVKSGKSFFNKTGPFVKGDEEHFKYWKNFIVPAFGVTYCPEQKALYWVNITEYLMKNKNSESFNIPIPNDNILNDETYDDFLDTCVKYALADKDRSDIRQRYNALYSDDNEIAVSALKSLFLFERQEKHFWHTILNYIYSCNNKNILEGIVYYIAIAVGHQYDVWWHKNNEIDQEISNWLKDELNKIIDSQILYKILSVVDEYSGLQRGTIGGLLVPFVKQITNRKKLFIEILFDEKNDLFIRDIALTFYLSELKKEEGLTFIEQQLALINNTQLPLNTPNVNLKELQDTLFNIKDLLMQDEEFSLI